MTKPKEDFEYNDIFVQTGYPGVMFGGWTP